MEPVTHPQIAGWDFLYMRTRASGSIPVDFTCGASDSNTSRNTRTLGTLSERTLIAASHFPSRLTVKLVRRSSAFVIWVTGIDWFFHVTVVAESPSPPNW